MLRQVPHGLQKHGGDRQRLAHPRPRRSQRLIVKRFQHCQKLSQSGVKIGEHRRWRRLPAYDATPPLAHLVEDRPQERRRIERFSVLRLGYLTSEERGARRQVPCELPAGVRGNPALRLPSPIANLPQESRELGGHSLDRSADHGAVWCPCHGHAVTPCYPSLRQPFTNSVAQLFACLRLHIRSPGLSFVLFVDPEPLLTG